MLIVCPGCKTRFSFEDAKVGAEGIKLRCNKCRAIFKVVRKAPPVGTESVKAATTATPNRIKVVVANESAAFCAAVKKVLASEPFDVHTFRDGREAMTAIEQICPDAVLLDVALPSMYGFEVCEAVRKNPALAQVKLILIASIYDKTRYKRAPQSLYGADDYIEKHHIPDLLATMIYRHVAGQKSLESAPEVRSAPLDEANALPEQLSPQELSAQQAARQELKRDEERETLSGTQEKVTPELPEIHSKAKRLARIIVSDIILYNQAKVEEGIKTGKFYDLIADDIAEGRALYERRVPEEVRNGTSYLDDAFEELIARKRRELQL
jgi:predicted Zn finger-like uncharacterized protein